MTTHYPLLVEQPYTTTATLEVRAPFNGALLATLDLANESIVEQALTTAYKLYQNREHGLPLAKRIQILEQIKQKMAAIMEDLALGAAAEGGKPLIDSRVEVNRAIDGIQLCIETLRTDVGHVIPMRYNAGSANRIAFTQKEPIGVVVAVSAFNHPLNLIVHQVATAIAAGCPVIVKPASNTPLSCVRFVQICHEAGLPIGWCQALIINENLLIGRLVADPRVGFFSFIGSAKVGWELRRTLAPGTRCSLEHGGVAPVIVTADADIARAVPLLVKGGFYHAGQVCVSVQRIYAARAIAQELASALALAAGQLKVGDPTLPETEVGPLIRPGEVDRIASWVDEAVSQGAELLCGGKKISDSCYACTVLYNPSDTAKVSQQEVFGPVICIYEYNDLEQAIIRANASPFSFQAAIFTRDLDVALKAYTRLNASAVMVNDHTAFRVDGMPFAGLKQSGLGVGGIPYTIHDMQVEKMLVIQSGVLAHW